MFVPTFLASADWTFWALSALVGAIAVLLHKDLQHLVDIVRQRFFYSVCFHNKDEPFGVLMRVFSDPRCLQSGNVRVLSRQKFNLMVHNKTTYQEYENAMIQEAMNKERSTRQIPSTGAHLLHIKSVGFVVLHIKSDNSTSYEGTKSVMTLHMLHSSVAAFYSFFNSIYRASETEGRIERYEVSKDSDEINWRKVDSVDEIDMCPRGLPVLPCGEREELFRLIESFHSAESKAAARRMGRKPRLGILLAGPPGCGKSMLAQAAVCEMMRLGLKAPFCRITESVRKSGCLKTLMNNVPTSANGIAGLVVVEDADQLLAKKRDEEGEVEDEEVSDEKGNKRTKRVDEAPLSEFLDAIENCTPGTIVIITTNHMDKFDRSQIRSGRVDHVIVFQPALEEQALQLFHHRFQGGPVEEKLANSFARTVSQTFCNPSKRRVIPHSGLGMVTGTRLSMADVSNLLCQPVSQAATLAHAEKVMKLLQEDPIKQ